MCSKSSIVYTLVVLALTPIVLIKAGERADGKAKASRDGDSIRHAVAAPHPPHHASR